MLKYITFAGDNTTTTLVQDVKTLIPFLESESNNAIDCLNKKENDCQCWQAQSIIVDKKTRSRERNFRNRKSSY